RTERGARLQSFPCPCPDGGPRRCVRSHAKCLPEIAQASACMRCVREETCPWILASATSPFTVVLPASLLQELSETSQALVAASFPLGETKPLQPNPFRAVRPETAFVLIKFVLVLPVIALDDPDLLVT